VTAIGNWLSQGQLNFVVVKLSPTFLPNLPSMPRILALCSLSRKELNDLKMRNKFLAACTFEYTKRNMAKWKSINKFQKKKVCIIIHILKFQSAYVCKSNTFRGIQYLMTFAVLCSDFFSCTQKNHKHCFQLLFG